MRVWLVTVGEPLPIDSGERLLRVGMVADLLAQKGHEVTWWTSTFNHNLKKQRFDKMTVIDHMPGYRLILLHGFSYTKNVSLKRLANHISVARQFREMSCSEPLPDVILTSVPTIELAFESSMYGKRNNIPVILDMRDMWPDIFLELVPAWLNGVSRFLLSPMFSSLSKACINATSIIGITHGFVDWGLRYAGRPQSPYDRDFPLAYSRSALKEDDVAAAVEFWKRLDVENDGKNFIVCFFGTIRPQIEIETICAAAKKLEMRRIPVKFVICGGGDNIAYYQHIMSNEPAIVFPGWVGKNEIWALMRMAQVGLAPYRSSPDFMMSLPNKVIEYLSSGLPILSSLKGELERFLSEHACGITYANDDGHGLADAIEKLYTDPQLQIEFSTNALHVFNEKFVAENVYQDMITYLETLACQQ